MTDERCDQCGKFTRAGDLTRQPYTQADYLFGGDPLWYCHLCVAPEVLEEGTKQ